MTLRADIAARIGRPDLAAATYQQTGTSVSDNGGGVGLSIGGSLTGGRDGLVLLAGLVIGLVAFSWWTR